MNLVLKLAPKENYFTEELVGTLWTELKLFISFWKRFSPAKAKKPSSFFTFLLPKQMKISKYETKSQSKGY